MLYMFSSRCLLITVLTISFLNLQTSTAYLSREPGDDHRAGEILDVTAQRSVHLVMNDDNTPKLEHSPEESRMADASEDETVYQNKFRLTTICIALSLTVFISALSNTIIATAIPTITAAFDSYEDIGWCSSGELITVSAAHVSRPKIHMY